MARKSASKGLLVSLVLGLVFYNVVMLVVVARSTDRGFRGYIGDEIVEQSVIFTGLINDTLATNYRVVDFTVQDAQEHFEDEGFDRAHVNKMCANATRKLGLDYMAYYDANQNQISALAYGTGFDPEFIKKALSGSDVSDIVFMGDDIYAVTGKAVKIHGVIQGCVLGTIQVSNHSLVKTVREYTNCEATIFSGGTRAYTSLPGMTGTQIDNMGIITSVMSTGEPEYIQTEIDGVSYMAYYFPLTNLEGKPMTVLFMGRELSGSKEVSRSVIFELSLIFISLTLVYLISLIVLVVVKMIRPVNSISKAVENLSSGDADLTQRLPAKGNNEYTKICTDINVFIENLQVIIRELNNTQKSITAIGEKLGANAQESASATQQILSNIEGVRKQSVNQSSAVQNTSSVLEQATGNFEILSHLIESQAEGITDSSAAIEQMLGNIASVTSSISKMAQSFKILEESVEEGSTKLKNVDGKVVEISEQSKMLSQANQIISKIASETNLLAMNAAIEAAHAGEAGRGFSVVADEIRKLAETSSLQSKNINVELRKITSSIQNVVELSRDSQATFDVIVDQLNSTDTIIREIDSAMNEQNEASHQILNSLSTIKTQSNEVKDKNEELSKGIEEVTKDMDTVSQITTVIGGSMDEMTSGAQEINGSAQNVSDLAIKTQENLHVMTDLLSKFNA